MQCLGKDANNPKVTINEDCEISLETNPICWRCEMSAIIVLSFQFGILHLLQTWTSFLQQLSNKICWNPRLLVVIDASTKASWRASVAEVAAQLPMPLNTNSPYLFLASNA